MRTSLTPWSLVDLLPRTCRTCTGVSYGSKADGRRRGERRLLSNRPDADANASQRRSASQTWLCWQSQRADDADRRLRARICAVHVTGLARESRIVLSIYPRCSPPCLGSAPVFDIVLSRAPRSQRRVFKPRNEAHEAPDAAVSEHQRRHPIRTTRTTRTVFFGVRSTQTPSPSGQARG